MFEMLEGPQLPCHVVVAPGPAAKLAEALVSKLNLPVIESGDHQDLVEALKGAVNMGITQNGWCPCGKRTYLLLRCRACRILLASQGRELDGPCGA